MLLGSFDIRIECALFGAGRDCVHVKGTSGPVTGVWASSRTLKENCRVAIEVLRTRTVDPVACCAVQLLAKRVLGTAMVDYKFQLQTYALLSYGLALVVVQIARYVDGDTCEIEKERCQMPRLALHRIDTHRCA